VYVYVYGEDAVSSMFTNGKVRCIGKDVGAKGKGRKFNY